MKLKYKVVAGSVVATESTDGTVWCTHILESDITFDADQLISVINESPTSWRDIVYCFTTLACKYYVSVGDTEVEVTER
jgi:hypothetical protein